MKVNVKIFGQLREITGKDDLFFNDVQDTDQLMVHLHLLFPYLKDARFACAVDRKIIRANTRLFDNSTVALLPPFSGG
jgi:molybdopterin synthase sulfur carrier subunit